MLNTDNQNILSDETLYRDYFTPVYRFLFFRTYDYDVASDLAQSVFLKFMLQKNKPVELVHAQKLLYTIARTSLIDYYRQVKTRATQTSAVLDFEPAVQPTAEDQASKLEDEEFLSTLIRALSHIEQEVVSLRLSSELSYEQIAELLNISSENCRQIHSRALKQIKQKAQNSNYFI